MLFFCFLKLAQQPHIEFRGLYHGLDGNALIVAVDHAPFLLGKAHGTEAVYLVRNAAVVP